MVKYFIVYILCIETTPRSKKKKQPTYKIFFFVKSPQKKLRRGLWAPYPYSQFISKVDEFQIRLSTIMDYNIVFHMCIEVLYGQGSLITELLIFIQYFVRLCVIT